MRSKILLVSIKAFICITIAENNTICSPYFQIAELFCYQGFLYATLYLAIYYLLTVMWSVLLLFCCISIEIPGKLLRCSVNVCQNIL